MIKILLLEDDNILAKTLTELLELEGYEVLRAKNGNEALDMSFDHSFDLMLLDVNVPFVNGFDFLKELRESGDATPAFFMTALIDKDSLSRGFDVGCDDYIKKPFDFDELLIRINAKLKIKSHLLTYKEITFDIKNNTITKEDMIVEMQQTDKQILLHFLKNSGKIINKNSLFELMEKPTELALRVHISKIKKALGINIQNIRGIGYKLEKI
ncbi:MAG: two-component system, OmpR family, response regulator [Sulfurospirillum sp.]|jgi:DNA-binding response OmpR family regulator|nr:two-component system, OmpR family, response regulator [Sulfurospirillum sp.]